MSYMYDDSRFKRCFTYFVDPDPTVHIYVDPDPIPYQSVSNLQPHT